MDTKKFDAKAMQDVAFDLEHETFSGCVARTTKDKKAIKYYSSDLSVFTVAPDPRDPYRFKGILRGAGLAYLRIAVDGQPGNEQVIAIHVNTNKVDTTVTFDKDEDSEQRDMEHRNDPNYRELGTLQPHIEKTEAAKRLTGNDEGEVETVK